MRIKLTHVYSYLLIKNDDLSQDLLDSGAALQESLRMDLDGDTVRDAENNINNDRYTDTSTRAHIVEGFYFIYRSERGSSSFSG